MRDVLLFGMTETQGFADLHAWATSSGVQDFVPDYHRLQLEYWVWSNRARLTGMVFDIGVQNPRRWLGAGYRTLGLYGCDVLGDLRAMPLLSESADGFIVTEVLEHCEDPFAAVRELYRVLKPGGLLLVTSPFVWPWHGTHEYRDFWRFTEDGWRLLLRSFSDVQVAACQWTDEGQSAYDLLRRFECMGHTRFTRAATGYLCEATK